jgi:flagellar biosynthesis/type III secretory pathway M-ring protein FliF/YscJ
MSSLPNNNEEQMILNQNLPSQTKQSIYKVALYVVLICAVLIIILIVLILIRRSTEKDDLITKKLEQREQELLEANKVIAQLRTFTPKKRNTESDLDVPIFDVDVPENISEVRPSKNKSNKRKEMLNLMNKKRETVADIFDRARIKEDDDVKTIKMSKTEEPMEESSSEDEKSINEALLSGGSLEN